jgi:hypothetical protein
MNHHIFLSHETPLAHEAGRKWLQVFAIYFGGKLYLGTQGQKCSLGTICYFEKENKVRPLRETDGNEYYMIVAFPEEIGWVFNEGPPHDHNYDYNNGHFLEVLHPQTTTDIISSKILIHIEVDLYFETGFESPLPYSPVYKDDKVIMNLKTFSDFLTKEPLADLSPEAVEKRKDVLSKVQKLGEEVWDSMDNEGDENEKHYWISGFIVGFNIGKD